MTTIDNRLADPDSLSGRRCTSSVLLKGLLYFFFFKIVLLSVAVVLALSI